MRHSGIKKALIEIPLALIVASVMLVVLLKWFPVLFTPLMIKRAVQNKTVEIHYRWVPIEKVSDNLKKAVIASEDQKFLTHNGFDIDEIKKMRQKHLKSGTPMRGCSTISQQTAKNCFTFGSHSWFRKGVEAYFTFLIEKIWGKKRILEVYLNVVELGPQIYGVEAASQHYYKCPAAKLSLMNSCTLSRILPNPIIPIVLLCRSCPTRLDNEKLYSLILL